jgi:sterol desaturase/sphingolipid hydroxylase (fatty acid hydroxylase superfamily)
MAKPQLHDELADIGALPEAERRAARAAHAAYITAHLRPAQWSEVGPDLFFVGVNAAVALFCAAVYASGAMPAIARCGELRLDWIAQVFAVNWAIMFCGYEGYHWVFHAGGFAFLYGGKPTKFNPEDYEPGQLVRERLFTTLSMGIASLYTCLALHGWARGWFTLTYFSVSAVPLWQFCATFLLLGLWSDFHFYIVHRLLHTELLYTPFHKLHHQSKNPGPWSGMSMHPVETTLYLSKMLGALLIPAHPLHFLFMLYNATLMPIPGHSGHKELLGNGAQRGKGGALGAERGRQRPLPPRLTHIHNCTRTPRRRVPLAAPPHVWLQLWQPRRAAGQALWHPLSAQARLCARGAQEQVRRPRQLPPPTLSLCTRQRTMRKGKKI